MAEVPLRKPKRDTTLDVVSQSVHSVREFPHRMVLRSLLSLHARAENGAFPHRTKGRVHMGKKTSNANIKTEAKVIASKIAAPTRIVSALTEPKAAPSVPSATEAVEEFDHSSNTPALSQAPVQEHSASVETLAEFGVAPDALSDPESFARFGSAVDGKPVNARAWGLSRPALSFPAPWRAASGAMIHLSSAELTKHGIVPGGPIHRVYCAERRVYRQLCEERAPSEGGSEHRGNVGPRRPWHERKAEFTSETAGELLAMHEKLAKSFDKSRIPAGMLDQIEAARLSLEIVGDALKAFPTDFQWTDPDAQGKATPEREWKVGDSCTIPEKYHTELAELVGVEANELSGAFTVTKVVTAMKAAVVVNTEGLRLPVQTRFLR